MLSLPARSGTWLCYNEIAWVTAIIRATPLNAEGIVALLASCTNSANKTKIIYPPVTGKTFVKVMVIVLRHGANLFIEDIETVERSFADAKQLYGHRYARFED